MLAKLLVSLALTAPLFAQTLVVDYPDSTLGALAGQYPIYTGAGTNVIRGQSLCPGTFAGLPTTTMVCTHVGVQLGEDPATGPAAYTQFVVRVGKTQTTPPWTNTWATNLPDQTVQVDLSGQTLTGGAGVNQWVEWPLAKPFVYNPGEGVVLDITSQAAVGGQYLRTAIGTGVARVISTNYTGSASGALAASGGIKFRLVFEPTGFVASGPGCPGTGGFVPALGTIGLPTLGNPAFVLTLDQALPSTIAVILFGNPTTVDIGGGCILRNDFALYLDFAVTNGTTPGTGTAAFALSIPAQPALTGYLADTQWAVLDAGSGSPLGFALSSSAKLVLF
jgi:hypothetical protein